MLMSRKDAWAEAMKRFPNSPSRMVDFYVSWRGLRRKGKFGRQKYVDKFGRGDGVLGSAGQCRRHAK